MYKTRGKPPRDDRKGLIERLISSFSSVCCSATDSERFLVDLQRILRLGERQATLQKVSKPLIIREILTFDAARRRFAPPRA